MNLKDVAKQRFANQHIAGSQLSSPKELVEWMGALQAQDYEMVKWAMGIRLPGSKCVNIEEAIAEGDIIRTHLLRPTWHIVSAENLSWILELTRPQIMTAMRSRHKYLGLTEKAIARSNDIIEEALKGGKQLIRKKLVEILENAGFPNNDNRASHLLLRAEQDGVICSGASKGKEYTYTLMHERIPQFRQLSMEGSLSKLAATYFNSHGPATLEDFTWWSGLKITDARKALKMIENDFNSVEIDSQTYWFSETSHSFVDNAVHLLPAYDEYIISYKDRSAVIADEHHKKAVSRNGIFRPAIVHKGQVIGIWKRSVKKKTAVVETEFFHEPEKHTIVSTEEAAEKYATFLGKELDLTSKIMD